MSPFIMSHMWYLKSLSVWKDQHHIQPVHISVLGKCAAVTLKMLPVKENLFSLLMMCVQSHNRSHCLFILVATPLWSYFLSKLLIFLFTFHEKVSSSHYSKIIVPFTTSYSSLWNHKARGLKMLSVVSNFQSCFFFLALL